MPARQGDDGNAHADEDGHERPVVAGAACGSTVSSCKHALHEIQRHRVAEGERDEAGPVDQGPGVPAHERRHVGRRRRNCGHHIAEPSRRDQPRGVRHETNQRDVFLNEVGPDGGIQTAGDGVRGDHDRRDDESGQIADAADDRQHPCRRRSGCPPIRIVTTRCQH